MDQLAGNLEYLMERAGLSQQALHRASGVSQAHIGNILHQRKSPTVDVLESLADAFRLRVWQLLAPRHILELGVTPDLAALIDRYADCDDPGRETILRVAEAQSRFQHP